MSLSFSYQIRFLFCAPHAKIELNRSDCKGQFFSEPYEPYLHRKARIFSNHTRGQCPLTFDTRALISEWRGYFYAP